MNDTVPSYISFIHELGILKILPRSGSFMAGVKNPDTVGEHVFRASQIAFLLAEGQGGNGEHASFLISFHDNAESRIGDLNRVNTKYISNKKEIEKQAFFDQIANLPQSIQLKYQESFLELEGNTTIEAKSAHDADYLELAFEAKKLLDQGYKAKQEWLYSIKTVLKTPLGKSIFKEMLVSDSDEWWKNIKKR